MLDKWVRSLLSYRREEISEAFDIHGVRQVGKDFRNAPTPHDIKAICDEERRHRMEMVNLASTPRLPRPECRSEGPRVTQEQFEQALSEVGLDPETMLAIKKFPMATSMRKARDLAAGTKRKELPREMYMTLDEIEAEGAQ